MPLTIDMAIAKTNKYASRESGDTVEIVERPGGGMSVIMADGQGTGRAAKSLSMLVTAKVAALIKEGVRDGACARAANDFLFAMRGGKVSATLDILSVDLKTKTVVITRNGNTSCLIATCEGIEVAHDAERPLGLHARTRPWTAELPISAGLRVVLVSDGVKHSGSRAGMPPFDLAGAVRRAGLSNSAEAMADALLAEALARDAQTPRDDMSVVALALPEHHETTLVRRMRALVPLP